MFIVSTAIALAATTSKGPRGVAAALHTAKHDRQVLRFFAHHRWLLRDPRYATEAKRQVATHRRSLTAATRYLAVHRTPASHRQQSRRLAVAAPETTSETVCRIFGSYCSEALRVARCESGLLTTARNGQYLGLFQMSSLARALFGHGDSAEEQSRAALRYFVQSGRDWSPWSCRPR